MIVRSRPVRMLALVALALLASIVPILAATPGEMSFGGSLFNPDNGKSVWSATAEYLIPLGDGPIYAGPSGSVFNGDDFDGGAVGVAGELHFGKLCGPGFGGAAHKTFGDAADQAAYTYEARALFECGTEQAAVKFTGRRVWSKAEDGATTEPDGTRVDGFFVWRF